MVIVIGFPRTIGRPRASLWTVLLALMVLSPFATAASTTSVDGDIESREVTIQEATRLGGTGLMLGAPIIENRLASADWLDFAAAEVDVTLHVQHKYAAGGLALISAQESPEKRNFSHSNVVGLLSPTGRLSWLLAEATSGDTTFSAGRVNDVIALQPRGSATFQSEGAAPGGALSDFTETALSYHTATIDVSNIHLHFEAASETWTLRGDVTLATYDFAIDLFDATGKTTYQTGLVAVDDPLNVPGVMQRYEDRSAELVFRNATLVYYPDSRPLTINFADLQVAPVGIVQLRGATGALAVGTATERIENALVALNMTQGTVDLAPADRQEKSISAQIAGRAVEVLSNGQSITPEAAAGRPAPSTSTLPMAWTAAAATLLAMGGWWVVRQARLRNHPDIFIHYAEEDYLRGRYRRSAGVAYRLLALNPDDTGAAVVGTMACLKAGRPGTVVRRLSRTLEHSADDSGLLHLMLSIGLFEVGQEAYGASALATALLRNPHLASELDGTELSARMMELPGARHAMAGDGLSYV